MDFRLKDPEDMTPEERLERIVEILAEAVVRIIPKEKMEEAMPMSQVSPSQPQEVWLYPSKPGRIPFGQREVDGRRILSQEELLWIKRIQELSAKGHSSERIAKRLNEEDQESKRAGRWSKVAVWRILRRFKQEERYKMFRNGELVCGELSEIPMLS